MLIHKKRKKCYKKKETFLFMIAILKLSRPKMKTTPLRCGEAVDGASATLRDAVVVVVDDVCLRLGGACSVLRCSPAFTVAWEKDSKAPDLNLIHFFYICMNLVCCVVFNNHLTLFTFVAFGLLYYYFFVYSMREQHHWLS